MSGLGDVVTKPKDTASSPFGSSATFGGRNTPVQLGISTNDKNYASKVNAALARKDWSDYQRTYKPVHALFKDMVMSDTMVNEQLGRVGQNVDNAFSRQQAAADSRMQRMGLADADMGRMDMSKALATANAENNVRTAGKDRSMAAIAGAPMPTAGA